jgi:hypothetical protein
MTTSAAFASATTTAAATFAADVNTNHISDLSLFCCLFDSLQNQNALCRLTKKAEPRRIYGVNRDSGTASATRRWLRRLVRRHKYPQSGLVSCVRSHASRRINDDGMSMKPANISIKCSENTPVSMMAHANVPTTAVNK